MRLLFIHDHRFYSDASGVVFTSGSLPAEVWPRYLAHFDAVEVLARDGGAPPDGAKLAVSSHPQVTFNLIGGVSYLGLIMASKALRQQVRAAVANADAVIARIPSELGFIAAAECRRIGKPYGVEMVGCAWDAMRNHGSRVARIYAPLFFLRTKRALRQAGLSLYVTRQWLQQRYPTAGKAYGASDVEIAPLSDERMRARQARLSAIRSGTSPVLGTVASLRIRSKGIQTALAALKVLREQGIHLEYRVLGPGNPAPWQALAEQEGVADLVSFDGIRPAGQGVWSWLDEIDVHLQPSFQEGLPRATVEAMSRGAACIGSTCGGIPELIPPERLHVPGDVSGLAKLIRTLVTDPDALADAAFQDLETSAAFEPGRLAAVRSSFFNDLRERAEKGKP
jgi:glycosyltransferase involved in cell wall biosynthesis